MRKHKFGQVTTQAFMSWFQHYSAISKTRNRRVERDSILTSGYGTQNLKVQGFAIQDGGNICVSCENWFLLSYFQISRFLKNFFYVLYGFQIQTSHGRMLSEINQNGGINQDGGIFVVLF
jgi:hypothetical protein